MYELKWPFLLMYGSHAMRQIGFPRVNGLSTGPPGFGASQQICPSLIEFISEESV